MPDPNNPTGELTLLQTQAFLDSHGDKTEEELLQLLSEKIMHLNPEALRLVIQKLAWNENESSD